MQSYFTLIVLALICVVALMCLIGIANVLENVCTECEDESEEDDGAASLSEQAASNECSSSSRYSHPRVRRAREFSPTPTFRE